jgi:cobalt-zinc-cadmium resistance protein CzcA
MHSRKLGEGKVLTQDEMNHEVISSSTRMMNSAVFGQVIILIVYLPIFMLEGIEGKMFKPMAQTVAFALLGAFISVAYLHPHDEQLIPE